MTDEDSQQCPVCQTEMDKCEFDGDWLVFVCSDDECETKIETPTGNPQEDGFTMESLKLASDYADSS